MKTDRELLELAARAAGLKYCQRGEEMVAIGAANIPLRWNPLADDSDALWLAVTLRIDIVFFNGFGEVRAEHCDGDYQQCNEDYSDDVHSATRRAIVRAAAAIGEAMP